ncbi:MAG: hypothetical protein WED04_03215 [Promethearchaeati archaeon SRVP18_Atabeyarchaeia-1]
MVRQVRRPIERLTDMLLLLFLINDVNDKDHNCGITKLQKLVFLSQLEMNNHRQKGFSYKFVKINLGPVSGQIEKTDIPKLEKVGYLAQEQVGNFNKFVASESGSRFLSHLSGIFHRNERFVQIISRINEKYSGMSATDLVNEVHSMPNPYRRNLTIDETPQGEVLLSKISDKATQTRFDFTGNELATLELYFDAEARESVERAMSSALSEPSVPWEVVLRHAEEALRGKGQQRL